MAASAAGEAASAFALSSNAQCWEFLKGDKGAAALLLDRSGSGRIQSWLEFWIRLFTPGPESSCGVEADGSTDWWMLESPQPVVTQRKDSDIPPKSSFYLGRTDVFG